MNDKVSASILVTCYNKDQFIHKTIISCLNQKFKSYEILVYNDVSTDNSFEILKKFKKKIKIIQNKRKKFISGPLNQIYGIINLFKISKGKIIFLLDGDDRYSSNKLKTIIKSFDKNKKLNLLQDKPFSKRKKNFLKLKTKKNIPYIWPSFYPTSCISIRRSFFKKFLKYIQANKFSNLEIDARISMFAFLSGNLFFIKKNLTYYDHDKFGIMSNYNKFSLNWWRKRNDAFDYFFFLKKKFDKKTIYSFDFIITKLINLFI